MLVLTRKPGEQIVIAGNITISIVSVGPGRVKIGVEAPAHVSIDRQEIHAKKAYEEATSVNIGEMPEAVAGESEIMIPPAAPTLPALHNRIKSLRSAARSRPVVDKPR